MPGRKQKKGVTAKKGPIRRTAETVRKTAKKGVRKVKKTVESNTWKSAAYTGAGILIGFFTGVVFGPKGK